MTLLDNFDIKVLEDGLVLQRPVERKGIISTDHLPRFEHFNAESIEEALFLLRKYGTRSAVIAGGTDLLSELKARVHPTHPEVLINIKSICRPSLNYVEEDITGLKIGSVTGLREIETNELIEERYGFLSQAAHVAGVPQYRNMATLGGDLCQHVRCWYYRASGNAFFCYRKGGSRCYAVEEDNRYHAVVGSKGCFAVCPSEIAPALIALDAKVRLSEISGDRVVPLEEFFTPLGNVLKPGEILTEVQIPNPKPNSRGIFIKLGLRNAFDTAIASVAVVIATEEGLCTSVNIVLGRVSPLPWRAVRAEEVLVGERLSKHRAEDAARAAIQGATPLPMNAYKLDIVEALVRRAILGVIDARIDNVGN